jgi:hypothetical protein
MLARQFNETGLDHDLERSLIIAQWAYRQGQASGARLWLRSGQFENFDYRWQSALQVPGGLRLAAQEPPPTYD